MFSKNDRFTLIATALLGILLYAWLKFAEDLRNAPTVEAALGLESPQVAKEEPVREESLPEPPAATPDPKLPRITNHADLVAFLDERGLNGRLLVDQAATWYRDKGFLGAIEYLGVSSDDAPNAYYDTLDEATLKALSAGGDVGATQTLARMAMFMSPSVGLGLYQQAVSQGSIYAVIKVADTLSLFADARLADYASEPELFNQLLQVQKRSPGQILDTEAYATALAALGDGGPPIVDEELLAWTATLEAKAPQQALEYACRRSGEILVDNSTLRRANNVEPLSTQPPPIFIGPPGVAARMPCTATSYPIVSLMNIEQCEVERFVNSAGEESDLHICQP